MRKLLVILGVIAGLVLLLGVLLFFRASEVSGQDRVTIKPYLTKVESFHYLYYIDEHGKMRVSGTIPKTIFRSSTPDIDYTKVIGFEVRPQPLERKPKQLERLSQPKEPSVSGTMSITIVDDYYYDPDSLTYFIKTFNFVRYHGQLMSEKWSITYPPLYFYKGGLSK